jgi:hypothetical protein
LEVYWPWGGKSKFYFINAFLLHLGNFFLLSQTRPAVPVAKATKPGMDEIMRTRMKL